MKDTDIIIETMDNSRKKPRCYILVSDFANIVKAFMGSNYLSIAYAFKQSGLIAGIIGLLVIASVTDHCCTLIVKCKYHAIHLLLNKHLTPATSLSTKTSDTSIKSYGKSEEIADKEEIIKISNRMTRSLTYGDIGKIACGNFGLFIVNACVIFTQFGFCVGYFIFVGNTVFSLFPTTSTSFNSTGTDPTVVTTVSAVTSVNKSNNYYTENRQTLLASIFDYANFTQVSDSSRRVPDHLQQTSITNSSFTFMDNSTSYISISDAPDLRLLVISPLPTFVAFALLRNIRHLGFVSIGADVSIFLGCSITLIYIVIGFELSSSWEMFSWTFPVFFGMVTSSYEGIGTIIPIESSMEGNRHNFSKFLHGAVFILTCVLILFGIIGYLQNGDTTEQMLNKHIPTSDGFGMAINIFLCVGVILTFPLQIYPVIELTELYLFRQGAICGSKVVSNNYDEDGWAKKNEDKVAMLPKEETIISTPVALTVGNEVPTWKRNLLRLFIVLIAAGIAVLMRDLFAYVNAFIGAIGSSLLAYVLPCLFHLRLCWPKLGYGIRAKDILIIVFGMVASVVSLYTTILEVIKKV